MDSTQTERRRRRRKRPWALIPVMLLFPVVVVETVPTYRKEDPHTPVVVDQAPVVLPPSSMAIKAATETSPTTTTTTSTNTIVAPAKPPDKPVTPVRPPSYENFLIWCRNVLGIQSTLAIESFPYLDYLKAHNSNAIDYDDFCDDDDFVPPEDFDQLSIRGLAAAQDIQVGDVVLSIPINAMISVGTTVDHDPVLGRLLGPKAREAYGWDDSYFEMAILTVAILYHRNLGVSSPLYQYVKVLVEERTESMPVLWPKDRLRQEASDGVRTIARGIQRDIKEMYQSVVDILRVEHPHVFDSEAYSLEMFSWAFALVNSRHWHLPVPDFEHHPPPPRPTRDGTPSNRSPPTVGEQVPPADQPTEEWVRGQTDTRDDADETMEVPTSSHSFLAPVADLLNFGPPCTRGKFNMETQSFEVVATCPFKQGQEVTYWYSDECDDVIIANYGFTHPLVPPCPSDQDWRNKNELWTRQVESLEMEVGKAYAELERLDRELDRMTLRMKDCDCEKEEEDDDPNDDSPRATAHAADTPPNSDVHVRGGSPHNERRIRSTWTHRKSDLGL